MSSLRFRNPALDSSHRWRDRVREAGADRRRAWTIGGSLLLHALLVAALLALPKRDDGEASQPPSYELMFDGGASPETPTTPGLPPAGAAPQADQPTPAPPSDAKPPPPAPQQDALPGPESMPTELPKPDAPVQAVPPAEPAPPLATPQPAQPSAEPAPEPETVPLPAPAPPAAVIPEATDRLPASPPQVRLETPPPEPPPRPAPDLVLPTPPLPPLPAPPRPVPRPPSAPPPRSAPPPQSAPSPRSAPPPGTLGNPMDLSFNPAPSRLAAPRPNAPRGSVASRSLDLSPGAPKGPNRSEMYFDARAAKLGADWRDGLMSYWLNHRYYPRQAAESGEDGSLDIELTVNGSGKVQGVTLKSRSGSAFIDMAAVGTWRNAQLRPLPPELGDSYTFTITLNYILIR